MGQLPKFNTENEDLTVISVVQFEEAEVCEIKVKIYNQ